jgi:glycosyltransferase involved in cell wall biosynthesis
MTIPILSILIATRNRVPYCINAIETILDFEYETFELIIQDNSDTLELQNYIENRMVDQRLVYNYTPPPFSSIDNFNEVIGLAKGEYLCLIGDDDAVHPEIFNAVEWAESNNIPSITPTLKAIYRWPDACENPVENGSLTIGHISGDIKRKSTKNAIKDLMKNGGQGYLNLPFPKLYHGIIKREYMELIKKETGKYVGGLSPDIYIAIGLAKHIPEIVEIDYPLTLPGICGKSAPIEEKRNKYAKLEDAPHFRNRGLYQWSPEVPRFYSSANIWADSALAALRDLNLHVYIPKFNKYQLIFNYSDTDKAKSKDISEFLRHGVPFLIFSLRYGYNYLIYTLSKLKSRIKFRLGLMIGNTKLSKKLFNIEDIKSAIKHLMSLKSAAYLDNHKSRV